MRRGHLVRVEPAAAADTEVKAAATLVIASKRLSVEEPARIRAPIEYPVVPICR